MRVHDPSTIVKCKDQYWVFYTGRGVPSYRSKDLVKWEAGPHVFDATPGWVAHAVPENRGMVLLGAGHHSVELAGTRFTTRFRRSERIRPPLHW